MTVQGNFHVISKFKGEYNGFPYFKLNVKGTNGYAVNISASQDIYEKAVANSELSCDVSITEYKKKMKVKLV